MTGRTMPAAETKVIFGRNLRRARLQAEYSQGHLAERAGLTQSYVARLEKGQGNPPFDTLCVLASVIGRELPELLSASAEPQAAA